MRIMSDVSIMALKLVLLFQNKDPLLTTIQYRLVTEEAQSFLSIRIIVIIPICYRQMWYDMT